MRTLCTISNFFVNLKLFQKKRKTTEKFTESPGAPEDQLWWLQSQKLLPNPVFDPKNWANEDYIAHARHRCYRPHHRHYETRPSSVISASRNWMSLLLPPSVTRLVLGQPLLPLIAGYVCTLAAGRLGLEYLTFQLLFLEGSSTS